MPSVEPTKGKYIHRMNSIPEDITRFRRFKEGDQKAFEEVYEEYKIGVYAYAYKFLKVEKDAEDAAAESFLKFWKKRDTLTTPHHVPRLLFTITRNHCLNVIKKRKTYQNLDKQSAGWFYQEPTGLDIEQVHAELIQHIYREAQNLPQMTQKVFWMRFSQHKSPAEIAEHLGLDRKAVYNHVQAARTALKSALLKKGLGAAFVMLIITLSKNY